MVWVFCPLVRLPRKKSICQVHPSVVKSWCQNGPFSKIYTCNSSQRSNCRCKFIFRWWIVKQFSISKVELLHQQQRASFAWVFFLVLRYNLVPSHRWSFFQPTRLALQICGNSIDVSHAFKYFKISLIEHHKASKHGKLAMCQVFY